MKEKLLSVEDLTIDTGVQQMILKSRDEGVKTAFDRNSEIGARCTFGELGVCCKRCLAGPCRILPGGKGPQTGVCGATADQIVARNFLEMVAQGMAPHIEHAREVALTLLETAEGKAPYEIKNPEKLINIASRLGLTVDGKEIEEVAKDVALKALESFQQQYGILPWLEMNANQKTLARWKELNIIPANAHQELTVAINRVTMGSDADPVNLLLGVMRLGITDGYAGLHLSTDLQDVLFGTPGLVKSKYRLGVIKEKMVNISVHGHIPMLADKVVEWAEKLEDEAKAVGAEGINVFGICCSANEVLMRKGIPVATNFASQEAPILTGAVEAMAVDIQCVMPSLPTVSNDYHTEVITSLPYSKIPGASHIEFTPAKADEVAQAVVRKGIANFGKRDPEKMQIPPEIVDAYAGFSTEQIVEALKNVNPEDPLKPLVDNIKAGNILGVVALVGCTNPRVKQDWANVEMAKELLKHNVMVVATGCSAHSLGKFGLLSSEGLEYCGDGLKQVLTAVGQANGMEALPSVLHMGSCVDNSRIADLVSALADYIGVEAKDLPVAGSTPEIMNPKALAIGAYFLAHGVDVHVGIMPPIGGSELVTNVLTGSKEEHELTTDGLFGGKVIYEKDPIEAAHVVIERIKQKRAELFGE
ncbi:anaerobic carbon-monoxide dehydrogenase catalytic subunit [Tepidibacillus infernus]|uniref:Carbon monoxide dehydrogenase n=1 Tax=Tepidibacillus decaturensis TaxID=1413211 RepID=A0A135L3D0_9BACI|nr:anaerobic carbon-monoxide dehydrogenase catalytic subunit [Tepidibacillus decaturensis]KXG43495.1 carbon monoxide dehydrogenase [Tepidibacillus decaturensis]